MPDQLPTGLTPDESSFQPIGNSGGSPDSNSAPPSLTGDESTFQPLSGTSSPSSPSSGGSFQTPNGNSYTPGQSVQHSSGVHGEVTGQNSQTGNAEVKWHQGADQFKTGALVQANGHYGVVTGKTNNGKVMVDTGIHGVVSVSPGDLQDTGTIGSFASGVGQSFGKLASGAAKLFGVKNTNGLDQFNQEANQQSAVNPMSGKLGELAGDIVQFLGANGIVKAGTGAVSAIPAVEQYAQAAKITKALADHPILARILHAGINGAGAQGGLSAVQSGGDLGVTATGAATGAAADIGGELLPDAVGAVKSGVKKAGELINNAGEAGANAVKSVPDLPEKLWPAKVEVPTKQAFRDSLQPLHDAQVQKISDAITNSVKDEGLQAPVVNDIRKMPKLAADELRKEANLAYSQVDEAVEKATGQPGRYQATDDEIKNLQRQLRENSGDKEKAAKINESLSQQKALQSVQMQAIKDAGLEDVAAKATHLTKKASALEDLQEKLLGVVRDKGGENVQINPDNFLTQLHNLDNDVTYGKNGRLSQALGQHGQQLIQDVRGTAKQIRSAGDAQAELKRQAAEAIRQRKTTRNVGLGLAGAAGATGLGADIVRHVVE